MLIEVKAPAAVGMGWPAGSERVEPVRFRWTSYEGCCLGRLSTVHPAAD